MYQKTGVGLFGYLLLLKHNFLNFLITLLFLYPIITNTFSFLTKITIFKINDQCFIKTGRVLVHKLLKYVE